MARTITSADAVLILGSADFGLAAFQVQGFMADAAWAFEETDIAETVRGVDGKLSGGFVFGDLPFAISLQADSNAIDKFEALTLASKAQKTVYRVSGTLTIPAVGKSFTMTRGILTRYTPGPTGQRVLQGSTYTIQWEEVLPTPLV